MFRSISSKCGFNMFASIVQYTAPDIKHGHLAQTYRDVAAGKLEVSNPDNPYQNLNISSGNWSINFECKDTLTNITLTLAHGKPTIRIAVEQCGAYRMREYVNIMLRSGSTRQVSVVIHNQVMYMPLALAANMLNMEIFEEEMRCAEPNHLAVGVDPSVKSFDVEG